MEIAFCTLFENDHHHGVASLTNSLIAAGFRGHMWAGYRGQLPEWVTDAAIEGPDVVSLHASEKVTIHFVRVETPLHLAYYKPRFMQRILDELEPEADLVTYVDPDVVVKCDWFTLSGFFAEPAVSVIEDVNHYMPRRHPRRLQWAQHFAAHGISNVREVDAYYNAGFVAVHRDYESVLERWVTLCDIVIAHNGQATILAGHMNELFARTDQDALNFALTSLDVPLITAGPDAMDFAPGGFYLSHAIGSKKPWHLGYLHRALAGHPPSPAVKAYWTHAGGPLQTHTDRVTRRQRRLVRVASAIGRVYSRH